MTENSYNDKYISFWCTLQNITYILYFIFYNLCTDFCVFNLLLTFGVSLHLKHHTGNLKHEERGLNSLEQLHISIDQSQDNLSVGIELHPQKYVKCKR